MRLRSAVLVASALLVAVGAAGAAGELKVGYAYGFDIKHDPDNFGFDILKTKYGLQAKATELGGPSLRSVNIGFRLARTFPP